MEKSTWLWLWSARRGTIDICSGGAAVRLYLLELDPSGRVGAKSVSDESDYLAEPELLQRTDPGYEDVRPVAGVDEGVPTIVSTSDGVERLSSELLALCNAAWRLLLCASRYLPMSLTNSSSEWAELIVFVPPSEHHYDFGAHYDMAAAVNLLFFAMGLTCVSCQVRGVHVDSYNITLKAYREKGRAGRCSPDDLRVLLLPVSDQSTPCR
eukprot:jgi/Tetstr1/459605/TSEL_004968.t1